MTATNISRPAAALDLDGSAGLLLSQGGRPKLEIKRSQIPLAPAFSWTAHMAQGQTLQAAIVDLQLGSGTNPLTSYVAFTRVKHRNDLLIFRPFDREVFTHGNLEGA